MIKHLKKLRKEIEKWLNIPKILKANKVYISELKIAHDKIDFLEVCNKNKDEEIIKLKKRLEKWKQNI